MLQFNYGTKTVCSYISITVCNKVPIHSYRWLNWLKKPSGLGKLHHLWTELKCGQSARHAIWRTMNTQFLMKPTDNNSNFVESKFISCEIRNIVLIQYSSNFMNIFMKRLSLILIIVIALIRCHDFNFLSFSIRCWNNNFKKYQIRRGKYIIKFFFSYLWSFSKGTIYCYITENIISAHHMVHRGVDNFQVFFTRYFLNSKIN